MFVTEFVTGVAPAAIAALRLLKKRAAEIMAAPLLVGPPPKQFKSKLGLPEHTSANFWASFPVNRNLNGLALISAKKLYSLALATGVPNMDRVEIVCRELKDGADIGCRGAARAATASKNASSCTGQEAAISEAVAGWVLKGFAAGPFEKAEVPAAAKISGMMCRPKPNGSVRVILNLSAPAGVSVNDGIAAEEFPAVMSSTAKWLLVLNKAGRGALMTKIDWADAYKHIRVRPADRDLQWFQWLDKYFVELCLVFGAASSPGIYDRAAKVVLDIVLAASKFPREMVCQYLDDVCAAVPCGSVALDKFRAAYKEVAANVGVQLAPEDDPDKAFPPGTSGTVLGVFYDTISWTWRIPEEKLGRLNDQIRAAMDAKSLTQAEVWSLVGRIIHYGPLVPLGRFNIDKLIAINGKWAAKTAVVALSPAVLRQLEFWLVILNVTSGVAAIPPPPTWAPAWAREFFTDAAGGSASRIGLGCGGVSGDWWCYVPWQRKINCGVRYGGRRLGSKLSALELVAPLICLSSDPTLVRAQPVRILVDNSGSVKIWLKGYSSRCPLCTTLVSAMAAVAAALGTSVYVEKVARCSSPAASAADALSKADFEAARRLHPGMSTDPGWVAPAILAWVANPVEDPDLGERIIREIQPRAAVLR